MREMDEKTREHMVKVFGRFIFAEIPMTEETRTMTIGGEEMSFDNISIADPQHPVLQDLRDTAKECGLTVRVWHTGMVATMELNPNRLNVHIEKSEDGKWRISERMNMDASPDIMRSMAEIIARGTDRAVQVRKPLSFKKGLTP